MLNHLCWTSPRRFGLLLMLLAAGALPAGAAAPRHVILCIGDGMGFNHVALASLWATGRLDAAPFADWPVRLALSTQPAGAAPYKAAAFWSQSGLRRRGITDSAAAATALATGVKTANGMLGLTPDGRPLHNLTEWLGERGLATGLVTSVPFVHATPAGFAVHVEDRDDYRAIARQLLLESHLRVLMGCGHPAYGEDGRHLDKPRGFARVGGRELWAGLEAGATAFDLDGDGSFDAELIDLDGDGLRDSWHLVGERADVQALAEGPTPLRLLVVPRGGNTLQADRPGARHQAPYTVPFNEQSPTLAEMSLAALNVLDADPDGFFLLIEGGAIDWAAHDNDAGRLVEEQLAFNAAVAAVVDWVARESNWEETLLIVTADHETGGLVAPGWGRRRWQPLRSRGIHRLARHHWTSSDHSGALVPLYAIGCGSETLTALAEGVDPRRGAYLDNTAIAPAIRALWRHP